MREHYTFLCFVEDMPSALRRRDVKKWVCLEERWAVLVTGVVHLDKGYKQVHRHS